MEKPLMGMTVNPYGDDYLAPAFLSLVNFAYAEENNRYRFKKDTGMDITRIVGAIGLDKMIDEAAGYQEVVLAKWCDWVAINYWGLEVEDGD